MTYTDRDKAKTQANKGAQNGKDKVKGGKNQSEIADKNNSNSLSRKNAKESGRDTPESSKQRSDLQETTKDPLNWGKSAKMTLKEMASHSNDENQNPEKETTSGSFELEKNDDQHEEGETDDSKSSSDEDDDEQVCQRTSTVNVDRRFSLIILVFKGLGNQMNCSLLEVSVGTQLTDFIYRADFLHGVVWHKR